MEKNLANFIIGPFDNYYRMRHSFKKLIFPHRLPQNAADFVTILLKFELQI
jgi:hypothetical protein